jgi:hypothetical protein
MSDTPRLDHLTADVGKAILAAVVDELKGQQKGFALCTESQQENTIRRLDTRIRSAVRIGFQTMVAGDMPHAVATLEEVKFNAKGCAGKLALAATDDSRHDLSDYAGRPVVIVLASAEDYLKRMDDVRGEADQRQLEIPDADDTSGFDGERHDAPSPTDGSDDGDVGDPAVDPFPGEYTREAVIDALATIEIEAGLDIVNTWDQPTRKLVLDWAWAEHLHKFDATISVPPRPDVIPEEEE